MRNLYKIPFAVTGLTAGLASAQVLPPTSGAYTTDRSNTWVQDRVGDRISTVNMIMCVMGAMRGDAKVNQGAYVALIDQEKCQGRGDNSKSTSSSAGASNATNFMTAVVQSTQASESAPLIMKAWLKDESEADHEALIYVYLEATAGRSDENPNGLFKMYFCGQPVGDTSDTCMFRGSLQSTAEGLRFYENEGGGGNVTQLVLQNNPVNDTGVGRIQGSNVDQPNENFSYQFAYNANHFKRQEEGQSEVCFSRSEDDAETSTWRYGTYRADGSRLEIDNPGFSVKYTLNGRTYYGFWSFWGLWMPEAVMADLALETPLGVMTRRVGDADQTVTPVTKGGKLWAMTLQTSSLGAMKNVPMSFWTNQEVVAGHANTSYELQWKDVAGQYKLMAVSYQNCSGDNGCSPAPLDTPVEITADMVRGWGYKSLQVFFPSGGGSGAIAVPDTGEFGADTAVRYRSRQLVSHAASALDLHCLTNCPESGNNLVSGGTLVDNPMKASSWGPSVSTTAYHFASGMLYEGGSVNDAAAVNAASASANSMGNYRWGINTGMMVAAANVGDILCDSQGRSASQEGHETLDRYCSHLIDQVTTVYQWETGPNAWNQYFGANGITIDAPLQLSFAVAAQFTDGVANPDNNVRGGGASQIGKYNGNVLALQFSGFGELQGVPGNCVNPDDNSPTQCGPGTRWVPAFDIKDGATVSGDGGTYFVRYLEREKRLGKVICDGSVSIDLTAAGALTLPSEGFVDINSRTQIGATVPTPSSTKPAVIDGIVQ